MTCGCTTASSTRIGVEFRQERVTGIDPAARRVITDVGSYDADFVVVAMGADYDMASTRGFEAGGFELSTVAGAERLRDALADFDGGRVLVSVLGQPFKCPPAPFEGAFLLHEYFTQRGIRESVQMTSGPRTVAKAGIFAESAARVVADDIAASIVGAQPPAPYGGAGGCYGEFGGGLVSKVEVNFLSGPAAAAQRNDPSREFAAEKEDFGATRRARWFGL